MWPAQPAKVVVPGAQTAATVQNLAPSQSYHFRILAENRLGTSDPSEVIQVTTQEEGTPLVILARFSRRLETVIANLFFSYRTA